MGNRDVDASIARIAEGQYGLFTLQQARRSGATRSQMEIRLANGRWVAVQPRVYTIAGIPSSWQRDLMGAHLAHPMVTISHRAAGALLRLEGVEPGALEVSVPRGTRPRLRGVKVYEVRGLGPQDRRRVGAFPVTSPVQTVFDLAGVLPVPVFENALDDALRRSLVTIPRLRRKLEASGGSGRQGTRVLRAALDIRDPSSRAVGSPLAARFLEVLRAGGLPEPAVEYRIVERGRTLGVVDFAYPGPRIVLEVLGYRYHSSRRHLDHDADRHTRITLSGWRILFFTWTSITTEPVEVCRTVAHALGLTAWQPPPRLLRLARASGDAMAGRT